MMQILRFVLIVPLILLLVSCAEEQNTGPGEVRWDREICTRCAMSVSNSNFAAQVRGGEPEKKTKLYKFDDLGCAVIWLDQQKWKDDPRTELWINDSETGKWVDAKKAWYVKVSNTPMDYGLGAIVEHKEGSLNFEQAKKHIYSVDKRFNMHSAQPLSPTTEQN